MNWERKRDSLKRKRTLASVRTVRKRTIKKRKRANGKRNWNGKEQNQRVGKNKINRARLGEKVIRLQGLNDLKWKAVITEKISRRRMKVSITWSGKTSSLIRIGDWEEKKRKRIVWGYEKNFKRIGGDERRFLEVSNTCYLIRRWRELKINCKRKHSFSSLKVI